ncbi:MAG: methyl-accepting chemotaxis protein [Candidatus Thiodiazotropha sp.]
MNLLNHLPIKVRLGALVFLLILVGLANSLLGISGMKDADSAVNNLFNKNLRHAELLGVIAEHNQELRTLLLLTLQHDPSSDFATMHDHPVSLHTDAIRADMDTINQAWNGYMMEAYPAGLKHHVEVFEKQKDVLFSKGYLPAIKKIEAGEYKSANYLLLTVINPAFGKMLKAVDVMIKQEKLAAEDAFNITHSNYHQMVTVLLVTLTIGILISILMAYVIISGLSKGVHQVELTANQLAEGDLTARMDYQAKDEMGHIATAVNNMAETFGTTVNEVKDAVSRLAAAAEETSVVTAQTTAGINQQQSETDQVATAMNQMSATVQEVARSAMEAASAAEEANVTFAEGKQVIDRVIQGIDNISGEVETASGVVQQLEQESKSIGAVLDVIKSIAEQTNLLALNAAIEAARAGEQGRGFAVVADEVRTLAGRTQASTTEIEEMICRLQAGTNNAVQAMTSGKEMTQVGVDQAAVAGEALLTINTAVGRISSMNTQIASAAEEQSAVTEEINRSIFSINEVAKQSAVGAEQTASASGDLAKLAEQLKGLVDRFKV